MHYLIFSSDVFETRDLIEYKIIKKENGWLFKVLYNEQTNPNQWHLSDIDLAGRVDYRIEMVDSDFAKEGIYFFEESYTYPGLSFRFSRIIFTISEHKNLSQVISNPRHSQMYYCEVGSLFPSTGFDPITNRRYNDFVPNDFAFQLNNRSDYIMFVQKYLIFMSKYRGLSIKDIHDADLFDNQLYKENVFLPSLVPLSFVYIPYFVPMQYTPIPVNAYTEDSAKVSWVDIVTAMVGTKGGFRKAAHFAERTKVTNLPSNETWVESASEPASTSSLSPKKRNKTSNRVEVLSGTVEHDKFYEGTTFVNSWISNVNSNTNALEDGDNERIESNSSQIDLKSSPHKTTKKLAMRKSKVSTKNQDLFLEHEYNNARKKERAEEEKVVLAETRRILKDLQKHVADLQIERNTISEDDISKHIAFNAAIDVTVMSWFQLNVHTINRIKEHKSAAELFTEQFHATLPQLKNMRFEIETVESNVMSPTAISLLMFAMIFMFQQEQMMKQAEYYKIGPKQYMFLEMTVGMLKIMASIVFASQVFFTARRIIQPNREREMLFSLNAKKLLTNMPENSNLVSKEVSKESPQQKKRLTYI